MPIPSLRQAVLGSVPVGSTAATPGRPAQRRRWIRAPPWGHCRRGCRLRVSALTLVYRRQRRTRSCRQPRIACADVHLVCCPPGRRRPPWVRVVPFHRCRNCARWRNHRRAIRCKSGAVTKNARDRWPDARAAVHQAAQRFTALVRSCATPTRTMATKAWTVSDSTVHVLSIAMLYVSLVDPDADPVPVPGLDSALQRTNVDTVSSLNVLVLRHMTERDADVLCRDLSSAVDHLLRATAQTEPGSVVRWLGGASVTVAGLLAHLTNELFIHGWDIARATGQPWPMPEADAALFFDLFFLDMVRHDHGVLIDTGARQPAGRIAVAFRSAYTAQTTTVLEDGRLTVAPPGTAPDARITYRPARFNLMLFGRIGLLSAVLHRDVIIGGPRPWLLPGFLRVVHMPNS
ncbi:maleylpyruvate isomerase N-terminal domain-containing protein [Micromonospora zamorensis]|uniref:maleylpyruvate isomerase N-terminal domain-containing protein n=1 Tax=Micromonospora zamorensis TaxID=709883 RepID=UPI003D8B73EB